MLPPAPSKAELVRSMRCSIVAFWLIPVLHLSCNFLTVSSKIVIPFLRYTYWQGRRDGLNQLKCKNARNRKVQVQVAMACSVLTVLAPKGDVCGHRPQGRHFCEEKERKEEGTMRETTYLWQARRDQPIA